MWCILIPKKNAYIMIIVSVFLCIHSIFTSSLLLFGVYFKLNENKLNQWIIKWKLLEIKNFEKKISWNKAHSLPFIFYFCFAISCKFLNFVVFFFMDNPWKFYVTFWEVFIFQRCIMLTWDCLSNGLWHEYVSFPDDNLPCPFLVLCSRGLSMWVSCSDDDGDICYWCYVIWADVIDAMWY